MTKRRPFLVVRILARLLRPVVDLILDEKLKEQVHRLTAANSSQPEGRR